MSCEIKTVGQMINYLQKFPKSTPIRQEGADNFLSFYGYGHPAIPIKICSCRRFIKYDTAKSDNGKECDIVLIY